VNAGSSERAGRVFSFCSLFFFFSPKFSVFQRAGMGRRHGWARRRGEGPTEAAMTHDAEASITFRMK